MAQNGYVNLGKLFGGLIVQWGSFTTTKNILDEKLPIQFYPISFTTEVFFTNSSIYNIDSTIYHDFDLQPCEETNTSITFFSQLFNSSPNETTMGTILKYLAIGR